jgi:adenosine deaminase
MDVRGVDPEFVATLPKAELHVHLEGTLEPEMMLQAGRRNDVPLPWTSVAEVRSAYRFGNLEGFLEVLFRAAQVLRRQEDFYHDASRSARSMGGPRPRDRLGRS